MLYLHAETRKIVDTNINTATFGDLAAPIALLNVALPTKRSRMTGLFAWVLPHGKSSVQIWLKHAEHPCTLAAFIVLMQITAKKPCLVMA